MRGRDSRQTRHGKQSRSTYYRPVNIDGLPVYHTPFRNLLLAPPLSAIDSTPELPWQLHRTYRDELEQDQGVACLSSRQRRSSADFPENMIHEDDIGKDDLFWEVAGTRYRIARLPKRRHWPDMDSA